MIKSHLSTNIHKNYNFIFRDLLFALFLLIYWFDYQTPSSSNFMSYILIIIVLILVFLQYKHTNKIISPLIIWFIFWLLSIVIARINYDIYNLILVWDYSLFHLVYWNTIIFYITYRIFEKSRHLVYCRKSKIIKYNIEHMYMIIMLLLIIGIIGYLINILYFGYIPQFTSNVDESRREFILSPFFSIVNVTRIAYLFIPFILRSTLSTIKKNNIKIMALILILLTVFSGWRTYIFQIMLMYASSHFLIINAKEKKGKTDQKNSILLFALFAILMIAYIGITRGVSGEITIRYIFNFTIENVYLYIAPNFLNMQTAINSISPNYNLIYTSEFLWGVFLNSSRIPNYVELSFSTGAFNVSTYLLHPYADFGVLGTIIWTFTIAMISAISFNKSLITKSILSTTILAISLITIFNLHNGFFLRSSSIVLWVIISAFIHTMSRKYLIKTIT